MVSINLDPWGFLWLLELINSREGLFSDFKRVSCLWTWEVSMMRTADSNLRQIQQSLYFIALISLNLLGSFVVITLIASMLELGQCPSLLFLGSPSLRKAEWVKKGLGLLILNDYVLDSLVAWISEPKVSVAPINWHVLVLFLVNLDRVLQIMV